MKTLTKRQNDILMFIRSFLEDHKFPPTFREISEFFKISVRGSYDHIKALEKKGVLRCDPNRSRAIEIISHDDDQPNDLPESLVTPVPLLGTVVAGTPIMSEENLEGYIHVPRSMLHAGSNYFALKIKGESMINAGIHDGDLAVIRQQLVAENGDIVVAMVDEAVTLKRYYKQANRIQLKAENPAFAPIFVSELRILGKLSHLIRSY